MKPLFNFFILVFLITNNYQLYAQTDTGSFSGTVSDASGKPIIGATVVLINTDKGAVTNVKGAYTIEGIKSGNYSFEVSSVGLQKIKGSVSIKSGKVSIEKFSMQESVEQLSTLEIIAKSESQLKKEEPIQIESIRLKEVGAQIRDLSDALILLPGVRVMSSGSLGDRADISLNGISGQAVRTYVDGLPFEFLYPSISITNVPLVNIRRMDVYKGVVPVDVGTDAMAGAINIVTESKAQNYLDAFYSIGSFNTHQVGANLGVKLSEQTTLQLNTAYNYSDNNYEIDAERIASNGKIEQIRAERFNDAYELGHANVTLINTGGRIFDYIKIGTSYTDYLKEANNNVTISRIPWGSVLYKGKIAVGNLSVEKQLGSAVTFKNNLAYSYAVINTVDTASRIYSWDDTFEVRNDGKRGEFSPGNPIMSARKNNNFINRSTLEVKLSDNDEIIVSGVYAYQDIFGRDEMLTPENDALTFPQDLSKIVAGVQYTKKIKKLTLNFAGKYYHYALQGIDNANKSTSQEDSDFGFYGAAKYQVNERFFIRSSFERGLRIPNGGEFFGNGNNITPNTLLMPEESNNLNLAFSMHSKESASLPWGITVNGFLRDQENLVRLSGAEVLPRFINQKGVRTIGVEAEAYLKPTKHLKLTHNITKLEQEITELNQGDANRDQIGTPNPNIPGLVLFNELEFRGKKLFQKALQHRIYFQYYHVETFNHIPVGSIFNPDNWIPAQHRVNLGASVSLLKDNRLSVAANIFNLFDNKLYDNFNVPRPGRNYNIRLQYRLNNF